MRLGREQRREHPSIWATLVRIAPITPMIGGTLQTLLDWVKREESIMGDVTA